MTLCYRRFEKLFHKPDSGMCQVELTSDDFAERAVSTRTTHW